MPREASCTRNDNDNGPDESLCSRPFLARNLRYVWFDRCELEAASPSSFQVPVLRLTILHLSLRTPCRMKAFILVTSKKGSVHGCDAFAIAGREISLSAPHSDHPGESMTSCTQTFDLSSYLPFMGSHELVLRVELNETLETRRQNANIKLVGDFALSCALPITDQHGKKISLKLSSPGEHYKSPAFGVAMKFYPASLFISEEVSIEPHPSNVPEQQNGHEVGNSIRTKVGSGSSDNIETLRDLTIVQNENPESMNQIKHREEDLRRSVTMDILVHMDQDLSPECAPHFEEQLSQPCTIQIYRKTSSLYARAVIRLDFTCPLCLRSCRHLNILLFHLEIDHSRYDVSLKVLRCSENDLVLIETLSAMPFMLNVQLTAILLFVLKKVEHHHVGLPITSKIPVVNGAVSPEHDLLRVSGRVPGRELVPRSSRRTKESRSLEVQENITGSGCTRNLIAANTGFSESAPARSHWEGPSVVIFVNSDRYPSWFKPNRRLTVLGNPSSNSTASHPMATVPTPPASCASMEEQNMETIAENSNSTEGEDAAMVDFDELPLSRCFGCRTLHRASYSCNPDYCSWQCEIRHLNRHRYPSCHLAASEDTIMRPLAEKPAVGQFRPSAANFENGFRGRTIFHLVSVAPFELRHFHENDSDSEEEVDPSWRQQLNEEELRAVPSRPKRKVLWIMWNRFAFDKWAAGEFGDRYTRYSLELFVCFRRIEILRLGLRFELLCFLRALHVHGCIDGPAIISVMKCLDGHKSIGECGESMYPKGIDVDGSRSKPSSKTAEPQRSRRRKRKRGGVG